MVSRGTPTKSESDKTDKPAKPTEEEVEEFGEDKEVKKNTSSIVSGAKTGIFIFTFNLIHIRILIRRGRSFPQSRSAVLPRKASANPREEPRSEA